LSLALLVRYKVRNLLGIRRARAVPRRGRKPSIGVGIVCGDVRMIVPAGMSDELWDWLMDQGWREVTYRPEHRTYRHIPASCVAILVDATEDERARVLEDAVASAELRACYRVDPDILPAYVQRR
jgi:hypothetical protein